jgi:hypothetical protein
MRNLGANGGGTLRNESPQQGHLPSCVVAAVASARNQCPRASHNWLMHCTVNPGRYCIRSLRSDVAGYNSGFAQINVAQNFEKK